jgi:hypothetical protein
MIKTNVVLNLTQPLTNLYINFSHSTEQESLLQKNAQNQIEQLLATFHKENINNNSNKAYDEFNPRRCNNTIFIHGERGAGKTTFLKAILNKYKSNELTTPKICPLPLIDPTLIETHQHILVDIVTKFVRLINKRLSCCKDESKYNLFRNKLEKMAEGLKLLTLKGHENNANSDAAWFLDRALNKATSGQDLEKLFHELIDVIAEILDKELFLIAIDDVDTQTSKANEVLEVLRCYLTHPKLVILLSGDLKLYSYIVRCNKEKEIGISTTQRNNQNRLELIGHLEQQYLTKLLPIEQRVYLKKLDELSEILTLKIEHEALKNIYGKNKIEINELLRLIFSDALNIKTEHLNSHLNFIMSQPVRSVLQLVKTLIEGPDHNKNSLRNNPIELKNAIYQNFIGNLVETTLRVENISEFNPHINAVGYELFKILFEHGELETGFYSRPDSSNDQPGYNAAKLYISATMADLLSEKNKNESFSNALKLIISCGASSSVYQTFVNKNLLDNHSFNDYIDYIGLNRNEDNIISITSHFSPIIMDQYNPTNQKGIISGVIRTPRKLNQKTKIRFEDFIKKHNINNSSRITTLSHLERIHDGFIHSENNTQDLSNYIAAKTILFSSHRSAVTAESRDYISIYNLLSSIAELTSSNPNNLDINKNLNNLANINTFIYPTFLTGKISGEEDITDNDLFEERESSYLPANVENAFEGLMKKWLAQLKEAEHSSLMIGKIWVRIFYTLSQVSDKALEKVNYTIGKEKDDIVLGVLYARFIWSIINSSLIEEIRYRKNISGKLLKAINSAKNTQSSPRELIQNIDNLNKENIVWSKDLPFTFNLISCPLFWPFLGAYTNGEGEEKLDLFNIINNILAYHNILYGNKKIDFKFIAENSNPMQLKISALPIMGCFRGDITKPSKSSVIPPRQQPSSGV